MTRTSFIAAVLFSTAILASPSLAKAQSALERLEEKVRKQANAARVESSADTVRKPSENSTAGAKESPIRDKSMASDSAGATAEKSPAGVVKPVRGRAATERGYLGAVTDDREDRGRGVRILRVIPNTAAQKAGLKVGDLITGVGGIRVRQLSDFAAIVEQAAVGDSLTFETLRGQERLKLDVTFTQRPAGRKAVDLAAKPNVSTPDEMSPSLVDIAEPVPPPPAPSEDLKANPSDGVSLESLQRRIEALERRIENLERLRTPPPADNP
jgi:C-terminal processing protease CtpA/Prc